MRGHLRQRTKGSWQICIELDPDPVTGKRNRIYRTEQGRKPDVDKIMRQMMHEIETGIYIPQEEIILSDYLNRWLTDYAASRVAPKTYARYAEIIKNHVIPALGNIKLQDLRPMHLQNLYSELLKGGRLDGKEGGLSAQTVQHYHRLIRSALQQAVRWQLLSRNPADAVTPPRPRKDQEMKILNQEQVQTLLALVKEHSPQYYLMVLIAISTGMRRGEIYGLRWVDVDIPKRTVFVRQVAQRAKGKGVFFKEPKTKRSKRNLPIPHSVAKELAAHKTGQAENRLAFGPDYKDHGLVFCQHNGMPGSPDSVTNWFAKFVDTNELPDVRFHDLRHTHFSLLIEQGEHPKTISERAGHSSIATTMDIYGHLFPGIQEAAADKFEELVLKS